MSWALINLDKDIDLLGVVFSSYIEDLCNKKDDKDHIEEVELLHGTFGDHPGGHAVANCVLRQDLSKCDMHHELRETF